MYMYMHTLMYTIILFHINTYSYTHLWAIYIYIYVCVCLNVELDGKIEMLKKIHSEKNNDDGVYKKVDDDIDVKVTSVFMYK